MEAAAEPASPAGLSGGKEVKTLQDRIVDADVKCRQALARATDAREAGRHQAAEKHEQAAQNWLDKLNRLQGWA